MPEVQARFQDECRSEHRTSKLQRGDRRYKERVSEFLESRRGKMFGVAEVVALAGSCFVLALVLFSYLYFLVPARSRISSLNADRKQLQTNSKRWMGLLIRSRARSRQSIALRQA